MWVTCTFIKNQTIDLIIMFSFNRGEDVYSFYQWSKVVMKIKFAALVNIKQLFT